MPGTPVNQQLDLAYSRHIVCQPAITGRSIAGASLQPGGASAELRCPPASDPFWERPNVIVTPCRGTSVKTNDKARNLIFDNYRRLDSGEQLLGLVDKVAGY